MSPSSLTNFLLEWAQKTPAQIAVRFNAQTLTYAQLYEKVEQLAQAWLHVGMQKGERIALILPNSIEMVLSYLAIFKIGAIAVPINFNFAGERLQYILQHSEAKVIVTDQTHWQNIQAILPHSTFSTLPIYLTDPKEKISAPLQAFSSLLTEKFPVTLKYPTIEEEDVAAIFYTSGTTGIPKGVMHTHRSLSALMENQAVTQQMCEEDISLVFLLLCYIAGFGGQMLPTLYHGGTLILMAAFDPLQAWKNVAANKITRLMLIPPQLEALLHTAQKMKISSTSLRSCICGGDALPVAVNQTFEALIGLPVCETGGMTESFSYVMNHPFGKIQRGSMGQAIHDTVVEIVNPNNHERLPPGTIGEIRVKSKANCAGYWHNPEATQQILPDDGWLYTGDLGYTDKEGFIWFSGRKSERIVLPQGSASPQEIENVFYGHPSIAEVAVMGKMNAQQQQEVYAYVVLHPEQNKVTSETLKIFAEKLLPAWEIPAHIIFVSSLPHNATGKLDRKLMTKMMGAEK